MYIALLLRISNLCVLNFSLVTFPLISSPLEYSWISWKTKKVLDHHLYQLPRSVSITNYLCLNQALGKLQSQTCRAKFGSNVTINKWICKYSFSFQCIVYVKIMFMHLRDRLHHLEGGKGLETVLRAKSKAWTTNIYIHILLFSHKFS